MGNCDDKLSGRGVLPKRTKSKNIKNQGVWNHVYRFVGVSLWFYGGGVGDLRVGKSDS